MKRIKIARVLVILGCVNLFLGAAFHEFGGYPRVSAALQASSLNPAFQGAMRAVFLLAGWDWLVLGILAFLAALSEAKLRRAVVLLCGLALAADAVVMFALIGPFIGDEMFAVTAALLLAGGFLLPSAAA